MGFPLSAGHCAAEIYRPKSPEHSIRQPGRGAMARSNRLLAQAPTISIYAHNEESYIRDDYSCRRLLIILSLMQTWATSLRLQMASGRYLHL